MDREVVRPRRLGAVLIAALSLAASAAAQQSASPAPDQRGQVAPSGEHEEHMLHAADPNPMTRDASGTSWLPVASPMYAVRVQAGAWAWMAHGSLFVQYLEDRGARGHAQTGSINWLMVTGQRTVLGGRFGVRAMTSAEPATIRGCGYPDLLASGERCQGEGIVDRQHPHDAFMELALSYDRPIGTVVRWHVYGGPVGEPALGPPAFPHRPSAIANPLAPIAHHWLDATHITFGVVTGAVYGPQWKVESSVFNGREPDEKRTDLDLDRMDSFSGRATFLPGAGVAVQVSAGRLKEAEPGEPFELPADVTRVTASVLVQRTIGERGWWAGTAAWGSNHVRGGVSHAVLGEATVTPDDVNAWFGRAEIAGKEAHDLSLHGPRQMFTVAKLQGGYVRYFKARAGLQPGMGLTLSAGIVPEPLRTVFGGRVNGGFGVFITVRPARHQM